jgi:hypothetical protein
VHHKIGDTRREEWHIAKMLHWMEDKTPPITLQVERATLSGCADFFLPQRAKQTIQQSQVRILCLTHADTLSDAALTHQIYIAEERNPDTAIFAIQILPDITQGKHVVTLRDGFLGATRICKDRRILLIGLPNAGKSSLIVPLTRERINRVKKKKEYHLARVSSTAGRTLGLKSHIFEGIDGTRINLQDTPGLRPRFMAYKDNTEIQSFLLAAKITERFKGWQTVLGSRPLEILIHALNRHGVISRETPAYVQRFGMASPTMHVHEFMEAAIHYERTRKVVRSSYKSSISNEKRQTMPITEHDIIHKIQLGEYGGLVFGDSPVVLDLPKLPIRRTSNAVLYMNQKAADLVKNGEAIIEKEKR